MFRIFENLIVLFRKQNSTVVMQDLITYGIEPLIAQFDSSYECIVEVFNEMAYVIVDWTFGWLIREIQRIDIQKDSGLFRTDSW